MDSRPVGLTKDSGWQIGVRRTVAMSAESAWKLITSEPGTRAWLGELTNPPLGDHEQYLLTDGTSGEVRVSSPGSHLRISRDPGGWDRASTIQVRVIPKGNRSVIAFHEEHLPSQEERIDRREHYRAALKQLESLVEDDKTSEL